MEDLLWRDGDRLVGFLGRYAFGAPTVGMVDPSYRRLEHSEHAPSIGFVRVTTEDYYALP